MKKITFLLFCIVLSTIFCSCGFSERNKVQTDSGKKYSVIDDTDSTGEFSFSGFSIKFSTADELKKASIITYDGEEKIGSSVNEAAKIGASILEKCYDKWSETNTIVVEKNPKANAWIVSGQLSGQLLSRKSTSGVGAVVFSIETGEVLYIGKDTPVS